MVMTEAMIEMTLSRLILKIVIVSMQIYHPRFEQTKGHTF